MRLVLKFVGPLSISLTFLLLFQPLFPSIAYAQKLDEVRQEIESIEFLRGEDRKIQPNPHYKDKRVSEVEVPPLGVKESEHPLGSGVNANDKVSPAGEQKNPIPQKEELTREKVQQIKEESKDSAKNLNERTTEYKKDGLNIQETSLGDRYKKVGEEYKELDLMPKKNKDGYSAKAEGYSFEVNYKNIEEGISLRSGENTISFSPLNANKNIQPEEQNGAIIYRNSWDGVDLYYEYKGDALKEYIILNEFIENPVFEFEVKGGTLRRSDKVEGGLELITEKETLFISPLSISLNDIGPVGSEMMKYEILEGNILRVTVDIEWLKSQKEESYPVVIDPTVYKNVALSGTDYVSYKETALSCNYTTCHMNVGTVTHPDTSVWRWRTVVKFDYTVLSGKHLRAAGLYLVKAPNSPTPSGTSSNFTINASFATCVAFNCIASSPQASITVGTDGLIDVTPVIQWMMDNGQWDASLILWGDESNGSSWKGLDSYNSQLVLIYNNFPPNDATLDYPADNSVLTNPTQVLKINPASADADGDAIKYHFVLSDSTGNIWQQQNSESLSMPISDGILQDGVTYNWKVYVNDGYYEHSTPAVSKTFKADFRQNKDQTQTYDEAGPFAVNLATGNSYTSNGSHSMNALGGSIGLGLEYNSPYLTREGLSGKFYNNSNWSGDPAYTRLDQTLYYSWGSESPFIGVVDNDFSARWEGYYIAPRTGSYKFGTEADNILNFYGGGSLQYSSTTPVGTFMSTSVNLQAGEAWPIKIDFADTAGGASVYFYVRIDSDPDIKVPQSSLRTSPVASNHRNGLTGKYYLDSGNHDFNTNTQRFLMRNEPVVSFDWGAGSPTTGGPTDNFLVRYEGYLTAPLDGDYQFHIYSDDGVRMILNNEEILEDWTGHSYQATHSSTEYLEAGSINKIVIEYFETVGTAAIQLKWSGPISLSGAEINVENKYLSPEPNVLPVGWNLTKDVNGAIPFESLKVRPNSDVVMLSSGGTESLYVYDAGGYKPPTNEDGWLVKNSDDTYTFTDTVGTIYIYDDLDNSGTYRLKESSSPYDDKNPAGLKYEYASVGGSVPKLRKIIDGVDNSRYGQLYYEGETECEDGTLDNKVPTGYLCSFYTTDGNWTRFHYYQNKLSRIEYPGDAYFDYGYLSDGRISSLRDTAMIDAIAASQRDGNESGSKFNFEYDELGRMEELELPSNDNASDVQHTFEYLPGISKQHLVGSGITEPNGYSKYIEYDEKLRTTEVCDNLALCTVTEWDTNKDLVLSTTGPTGLKSTTIYDADDIPIEAYGPAPSGWFGSDRKPSSTYINQVPRTETAYDEGFTGPSVAFYQVKNDSLFGSPELHQLGIISGSSSSLTFDFTTQTFPITKDTGMDGVGFSATGKITFPQNGTYTFKSNSTDGARIFVDDKLIVNNWANRSSSQDLEQGTFVAVADKVYRVRIDWLSITTTPKFNATVSGPGVSETSTWTMLKPGFNLPTSNTVYDQQLGNIETETNYQDPAYGLVSDKTLDPSGLNYQSEATYESPGTGYFRQTSKTSPGGSVTNYNYYGATEQVDNVCVSGTQLISQAGFVKSKVEPFTNLVGINLVPNPSFEMADGSNPQNWVSNTWGTNTASFSYANTGYSGAKSAHVNMTSYTDGDAKWYHDEVAIEPERTYTFKDNYKSTTPTEVLIRYTTAPNTYTWEYKGWLGSSGNAWTSTQYSFTAPWNATHATAFHIVLGVGELWIDDVSITKDASQNMVLNPSMETAVSSSPEKWWTDNWGTNTATFTYENGGAADGSKSLKVAISSYTSGDSKWYPQEVSVVGGRTYTLSTSYKSNVSTLMYVRYKVGMSYNYVQLDSLAAAVNWTNYTKTFQIPDDVTEILFTHLITSVGELWIDNYSFIEANQPGRTTESIYDEAGRVIASRINDENWNCIDYDSRGRVIAKTIATNNGHTGKVVSNDFAVDGNPLVRNVSDGNTTIYSEYDFVGNLIRYVDAFGDVSVYEYDILGRLVEKISELGVEEWTYDAYSRVTSKDFNSTTYATVTYDAYNRVDSIDYPEAGQLEYTGTDRDDLDRPTKYNWKQSDGTVVSEEVTRSQSGLVLEQEFKQGVSTTYTQSYTFDKADRLVAADYGDRQYGYNYGTASNCAFTNSNKNFNRTSDSVTISGVTTTNNYCYDNADKLTSSTQYGSPNYDNHGNTIKLGNMAFGYDVSDQNISVVEGGNYIYYSRDVLGRITYSEFNSTDVKIYNFTSNSSSPDILRDENYDVVEKYISLPGLRMAVKTSSEEYSIMTSTGNLLVKDSGAMNRYDPFGTQIVGNVEYGFGGSELRETEKRFTIPFIQMGARVYIPTLGRFTQVDPVVGGNWNDYIYPLDPINSSDFNGLWVETAVDVAGTVLDVNDCFSYGDWFACGMMIIGVITIIAPIVPNFTVLRRSGNLVDTGADVAKKVDQTQNAKKLGSAGGPGTGKNFSASDINIVRSNSPGTCVYCSRKIDPLDTKNTHVDHIIPKSKGGNNTLDNAQVICSFCNLSKGNRSAPVNLPPISSIKSTPPMSSRKF